MIALLFLEAAVRVAFPYYSPSTQFALYRNPQGVTLGRPLTTSRQYTPKGDYDVTLNFNRYGFRDVRDLAESKSNDVFVAGDSFSAGWGLEETQRYSNLIEKELGIRAFNISIPEDIRGYITLVDYAKQNGANIGHLVIGLCMENDIWDYTIPESTHAIYARQMNPGALRAVWNWFKAHSALWICASHVVQKYPAGRALFEKLGIAKNIEALTHKNEYSPKILGATRDELLKLTTNYHSAVLVIPSRGLWYGQNVRIEEKIHDELTQMLRDAGVKLVDMRPVFEKTGKPLQFYFVNDPHWNAAGHKVAGEELARFLRGQDDWREVLSARNER